MPISQNSSKSIDRIPKENPGTNPTDTVKQNYDAIRYGNNHGSISFGQIDKKGEVTSSVLLQGSIGEHSFAMDEDGPRKGWTTSTSPGNFQVECGSSNEQAQDSLMLNAKNGNILIVATNGKIRFEADDIEFISRGTGTDQGNVKITATENFVVDAKKVLINSKSFFKIASSGSGEVCANSVLKTYGSIIRGVTDACAKKDSKVGGQRFQKQCSQVN